MYKNISIPTLAVIGDQEEYTAIPTEEALTLMQIENPRTEAHQLQNCDHDFQGKEEKLADIVFEFIQKQ